MLFLHSIESTVKTLQNILLPIALFSCLSAPVQLMAEPTPPEGFTALFDGESMDGWFTVPEAPQKAWKVDSKQATLGRSYRGGYIWTEKSYGDFILQLEYKISRLCNSGVFFRTDPKNPVQGGFEIQILDSKVMELLGPGREKHANGALYDAVAPSSDPAKPVGKWNRMRIRAKGDSVRIWINGTLVAEADLSKWTTPEMNPDGSKNKFKTALSKLPQTGHIGLQDHGHNVWFKNIFVKEL